MRARLAILAALAWASAANAQGAAAVASPPAAPPAAPSGASATPPSPQAVAEARARFQRALDLAEDGDFDAALLELRKAYELAPSYKILYNIGLVYQQLKEHARAYDAFERYLVEGGAEIEPERATEVRHRIERLEGRVGYLKVQTTLPGAEVFVDDLRVGETPLSAPLRVDSGQRRLTIRMAGHPTETRVVELAGGESKSISFELRLAGPAAAKPPRSPVPFVAWTVTGLLATAGAVTGILALSAEKTYDSDANTVGSNLGSDWDKLHTLAVTTDVLLGAAIVSAAVSTYFTIRPPKLTLKKEMSIRLLPGGVAGTF